MFRKLLLTSLGGVLASGDKPFSQLLIKIAISFAFLVFFVRHSPFAADEADISSQGASRIGATAPSAPRSSRRISCCIHVVPHLG